MARKVRLGVVRNGEHLSLHANHSEAEAAAEIECTRVQEAADAGWTTQRGADQTRVWIEEVRGNVW